MRSRPDLTGKRFNRLVALRPDPEDARYWETQCDCGNTKRVRGDHLMTGKIESCKCLQKERTIAARRTHGQSRTPEHIVWLAMRNRCSNPKAPHFDRYGGRGIRVCDRWQNSFAAFLEDMGPRPAGASIDRFPDNDGSYEKTNCRWATSAEQMRNTSKTRLLTNGAVTAPMVDMAAIVGIDQDTIQMRLRRGWSEVRALTQPPRTSRQRSKLSDDDVREIRKLRADGARPVDLARRFGVKAQTIVQIQKRQVFASLTDREGK